MAMTTERTLSRRTALGTLVAMVAFVVPLALVLREYGPGNMWRGVLVGAAIALTGGAVATWRVSRAHGSTADRAFLQVGDERDDAILTRAAAVAGVSALPLTALATVAVAVGADAVATLGVLLVIEAAVLAIAFVVVDRRS